MNYPVVKGASYILVHAEDMVIHNGTTQSTERVINPDSEYLKKLPNHLRSFDEAVNYLPNQVYIGNYKPEDLKNQQQPWYQNPLKDADRFGKFGEMMPEDEFIGLIKIVDVFDLVKLTKEFTEEVKAKLEVHPLIKGREDLISRLKTGDELSDIEKLIDEQGAEPLITGGNTVGCVKRAHDVDENLSAHVLFENLVSKASGVLAGLNLIAKNDINPDDVEYVIECSEEACGDMNQRGGGNFAKAIAEMVGLKNATGSDTRGFCAAPTHALIVAASLVQSGAFKNVVVLAGGSTAKLGMNGKNHVEKDMPILEDVIGGFAVLVSENDGVNPILRTDLIGRHTVGTGSSPQAVMSALVTAPLDKGNLKITDIDKYSVEMQNPDVTKPAGAGDVPTANYKMIGALGVMRKDLERAEINDFIGKHGMEGWAPTQGHIPSGVPYLGFAREDMLEDKIQRAMIVGKGSLFLGRMTNLFDGVSIVVEKNPGKADEEKGVSEEEVRKLVAEAMRDFASHLLQD
ncbi:Glycine/sarcosine/betaine reductase complex component C subunit beta [[Clostridium] ultunense Esp]|uniref:Glycine/sarcosine/betaine reductase complex component C subunit beta n=1 Tax=[Clostridium] ultunense Esp TaxID=1288971 RepID=M1ZBU6_9FIRM|nr:glycine/sarcosine/betaine reductase complex component C subunit beta [Schnuerera ultunensis]CCQ95238.1 Glycine/sarcosine/betaine reductase complex component C subunit beta [[Clostridium] ultunense Esp]SHD75876.1 Glycine/sarcosine/betaine reductase complex component C subunit beta [[Clostridium] ultunense Esp]